MSRIRCFHQLTLAWGMIASFGCGAPDAEVERLAQAQRVPNSGFVPYPILVDSNGAPVLGPDGAVQAGWDGSLTDLMAADAYSQCALSSTFHQSYNVVVAWSIVPLQLDEYMGHLRSKISAAVNVSGIPAFGIWKVRREDADFNVDPQTGQPARLEPLQREGGYESFYEFDASWGITGVPMGLSEWHMTAARQLAYMDLNLCMAQHLRAQLNGGQSLFLPTSDQVELLAVIRERAQLSVLYFDLLAKVLSSTEPVSLEVEWPATEYLVYIRRWAELAPSSELQRVGEDYATAVRILLQTTNDLAEVLQRQASTRPIQEAGFDRAARDWGIGQPRVRLMNLLYGGDPIGTPTFPHPPGRGRGGVGIRNQSAVGSDEPAYVATDMSEARLSTLLGLVRAADAVRMKVQLDESENIVGFDAADSAARMYRMAEVDLRVQACELETPENPSCEPSAVEATLPDLDEVDQYLLWQRHRVEPQHAVSLASALSEAFGPSVRAYHSNLRYAAGVLHFLGNHQTESFGGASWIHIDPDFSTRSPGGHELSFGFSDFGLPGMLPRTVSVNADPTQQGFFAVEGELPWQPWDAFRSLGAVPALIFTREALIQGSESSPFAEPFFSAASVVLSDIERAVGARTAIQRRRMNPVTIPCPVAPCTMFVLGSVTEVDVITRPEDPLDTLTVAPLTAQLRTLALDPDSRSFDGVDRATLDDYPTETMLSGTPHSYTGFAEGYELRSFEVARDGSKVLLLRGEDPEDVAGEKIYFPLYINWNSNHFMSEGGALNGVGERAMSVLTHDWSRPAFDAFGFPVDWVPPADASLVGGAAGEPSYQYYLRSAKEAAREATVAVQKAIDNLVEETLLGAGLEAAEQEASAISDIEARALCGPGENCDVKWISWQVPLPSCLDVGGALPAEAEAVCQLGHNRLYSLLPRVLDVPHVVLERIYGSSAPTFSEFGGSEVQRVLIRQWNAMRMLLRVTRDAMGVAVSAGREVDAAKNALTVAKVEIENAAIELELALELAEERVENACGEEAMRRAQESAFSWSNPKGRIWGREREGGDGTLEFSKSDGKTYNPGPEYAQQEQCADAKLEFDRVWELTHPDGSAVPPLKEKYRSAQSTVYASQAAASVQLAAALTQVQQALGEYLAATAELSQTQLRAEKAIAVANLERDLAEKQAEVRFGLNRKFRSYDMWRARALLESARRMAVAARRAIEAQFVVELSELNAPQAFVEAPAVWADEVYATDLDAPAVVGLSVAPVIENAIYPNGCISTISETKHRYAAARFVTVAL